MYVKIATNFLQQFWRARTVDAVLAVRKVGSFHSACGFLHKVDQSSAWRIIGYTTKSRVLRRSTLVPNFHANNRHGGSRRNCTASRYAQTPLANTCCKRKTSTMQQLHFARRSFLFWGVVFLASWKRNSTIVVWGCVRVKNGIWINDEKGPGWFFWGWTSTFGKRRFWEETAGEKNALVCVNTNPLKNKHPLSREGRETHKNLPFLVGWEKTRIL